MSSFSGDECDDDVRHSDDEISRREETERSAGAPHGSATSAVAAVPPPHTTGMSSGRGARSGSSKSSSSSESSANRSLFDDGVPPPHTPSCSDAEEDGEKKGMQRPQDKTIKERFPASKGSISADVQALFAGEGEFRGGVKQEQQVPAGNRGEVGATLARTLSQLLSGGCDVAPPSMHRQGPSKGGTSVKKATKNGQLAAVHAGRKKPRGTSPGQGAASNVDHAGTTTTATATVADEAEQRHQEHLVAPTDDERTEFLSEFIYRSWPDAEALELCRLQEVARHQELLRIQNELDRCVERMIDEMQWYRMEWERKKRSETLLVDQFDHLGHHVPRALRMSLAAASGRDNDDLVPPPLVRGGGGGGGDGALPPPSGVTTLLPRVLQQQPQQTKPTSSAVGLATATSSPTLNDEEDDVLGGAAAAAATTTAVDVANSGSPIRRRSLSFVDGGAGSGEGNGGGQGRVASFLRHRSSGSFSHQNAVATTRSPDAPTTLHRSDSIASTSSSAAHSPLSSGLYGGAISQSLRSGSFRLPPKLVDEASAVLSALQAGAAADNVDSNSSPTSSSKAHPHQRQHHAGAAATTATAVADALTSPVSERRSSSPMLSGQFSPLLQSSLMLSSDEYDSDVVYGARSSANASPKTRIMEQHQRSPFSDGSSSLAADEQHHSAAPRVTAPEIPKILSKDNIFELKSRLLERLLRKTQRVQVLLRTQAPRLLGCAQRLMELETTASELRDANAALEAEHAATVAAIATHQSSVSYKNEAELAPMLQFALLEHRAAMQALQSDVTMWQAVGKQARLLAAADEKRVERLEEKTWLQAQHAIRSGDTFARLSELSSKQTRLLDKLHLAVDVEGMQARREQSVQESQHLLLHVDRPLAPSSSSPVKSSGAGASAAHPALAVGVSPTRSSVYGKPRAGRRAFEGDNDDDEKVSTMLPGLPMARQTADVYQRLTASVPAALPQQRRAGRHSDTEEKPGGAGGGRRNGRPDKKATAASAVVGNVWGRMQVESFL